MSSATLAPGGSGIISTRVNGDADFNARTTRRASALLLGEAGHERADLTIDQTVDTPIGSGFGASAAAATSAVYAVAAAAAFKRPKPELALYAHRAEIFEQTGLGTVSVIFDSVGAGAITVPGEPGAAQFVTVKVPKETRIVTAFLAPYDKKDALSSRPVSEKINRLGRSALDAFLADPNIDSLALQGERFSASLGLESPEVKRMIRLAKSAGASRASQNMIGYAIHCLVDSDGTAKVANALRGVGNVRVDVFEVGRQKAGVIRPSRRRRGPS
ncbi:MAG: hypothetical protein KGI38_07940 [Thaumarchaeota archaeon]|nr:hypothetical protein [Nitrososphaerota archaeon]